MALCRFKGAISILKNYYTNEQIRAKNVYVIDATGNNLGLLPYHQAQKLATDASLDLVQMSTKDNFPVCKILDYGKLKYENAKKESEQRRKQPKNAFKEIKLSTRIEKNDILTKLKKVNQLINDGFKVTVSVQFKGRENHYREIGYAVLENFKINGTQYSDIKSESNFIYMVLSKGA